MNSGCLVLVPCSCCTFGVRPCMRRRRCVRLRSDKPFETLLKEKGSQGGFITPPAYEYQKHTLQCVAVLGSFHRWCSSLLHGDLHIHVSTQAFWCAHLIMMSTNWVNLVVTPVTHSQLLMHVNANHHSYRKWWKVTFICIVSTFKLLFWSQHGAEYQIWKDSRKSWNTTLICNWKDWIYCQIISNFAWIWNKI